MPIELLDDIRIAGSVQSSGTFLVTLDPQVEVDLISRGKARRMNTPRVGGISTVVLGDSITYQGATWSSSVQGYTARGFWTWARVLSHQAIDVVHNAGKGGDTTTQMLARLATDVLDYDPQLVIIMGGINNIGGLNEGPQTCIRDMREMVAQLTGMGKDVIVAGILPPGDAYTNFTIQMQQRIRYVNDKYREICSSHPRARYWDTWPGFVSPTDTDAEAISGYYYDATELHPSSLGAFALGSSLATLLSSMYPQVKALLASDGDDRTTSSVTLTSVVGSGNVLTCTLAGHKFRVGDWVTISGASESGVNGTRQVLTYPNGNTFTVRGAFEGTATGTILCSNGTNFIDNGLMQGSGGTTTSPLTGSTPTGWVAERVSGSTIAAAVSSTAHDVAGNWTRFEISAGASGEMLQLRAPDASTYCAAGDLVYFEADINVGGTITGVRSVQALIQEIVGTTRTVYDLYDVGEAAFSAAWRGVVRTPVMRVRSGTIGRVRPAIQITGSGAISGATVDIGRARMVKVFPSS